ncbi:MAG: transglutaminase-like domain-containing protein [Candidatus Thermoplasmatota archaeon]|nr:transglutaminase domain-containing protein [Euryarchaeota archaeon]MBU4032342.1 transglutaminase-like domain-containing protein [Candidatus Thermoplasmatota archaeon]MBU4071745.1 transglutaminase-like domain-containing protein [Candidatus Thermoplasmatota archaeon]MBU4144839.1 transglutaminase-like domain-containing protein [Candidatus Thermoplasmatota archaeon]MBU4592152.1 transglutaminase-like domain-containing protein [Candidatus Thermoplasmatota archaeon]
MSGISNSTTGSLPPPPPDWQPQYHAPPPKRKSRAGKILAILLVLLILFSILFYTPIGKMFLAGITGNSYPSDSTFRLTREIEIDVDNGDINYLCDIPLPGTVAYSAGNAQRINKVNTQPVATNSDKYGNSWLEWSGSTDGTVTFEVTYWATVNTIIWDIGSGNSGMVSDIPSGLADVQTGNELEILDSADNPTGEYKIWPTHVTISKLANGLTSDDLTVYDNVKRIYNYVRGNVDYLTVSGSEAKSCLQTLADGTGDCDDQSILLISLCRSIGIPSWLAFGTLYDSIRNEWGAHAWAEVYIPLQDGTGEGVTIDTANKEFLVRNCNRLEEWKSDGIGDHLADYYNILSYNYSMLNPHQLPPEVTVSENYSGEYAASEEMVYALFDIYLESGLDNLTEIAVSLSSKSSGF